MNRDIANVVEIQHHVELEDIVYMETMVKRQIKRRGSTCFQTTLASFSSIWRLNLKRELVIQTKPYMHVRVKSLKDKKDAHMDENSKSEFHPTRDKYIKCFKCLGKGYITSKYPK